MVRRLWHLRSLRPALLSKRLRAPPPMCQRPLRRYANQLRARRQPQLQPARQRPSLHQMTVGMKICSKGWLLAIARRRFLMIVTIGVRVGLMLMVKLYECPSRGPQDESVDQAQVSSSGCTVTGGHWYGAFTGTWVTNPSSLDIDHFVPLASTCMPLVVGPGRQLPNATTTTTYPSQTS